MEQSSSISSFFLSPFFLGFYLGLFICLILIIRSVFKKRAYLKEIRQLKKHLQTKLEIESEATEMKKGELGKLKKENENLRISIQNLAQRPGKKEIRQLYVYQQAIEMMVERAPGFAQAWQSALRESELEFQKAEKGIKPFLRKLITPTKFLENPLKEE